MITDLFSFQWKVDQDGYTTQTDDDDNTGHPVSRERIIPRGPRWRYYRPLENDGLWLRFAEVCRSREGVLAFVNEFGMLGDSNTVEELLILAGQLRVLAEHVKGGERRAAAELFKNAENWSWWTRPTMHETIVESAEGLQLALVPDQLADALKHQAAEAITSTRAWQFRQCRNVGCANWFRVGQRAAGEGGRSSFTARREFCSDRCRVAWARRHKREMAAHA
jgi:hypothetical protein